MTRALKLVAAITAVISALLPVTAQADVPDRNYWRWFEVEVLLFRHTQQQDINEQFPLQITAIESLQGRDLLSRYFAPDLLALRAGLEQCQPWSPEADWEFRVSCQYNEEDSLIPIPGSPFKKPETLSQLQQTDVIVNGAGGNIAHARAPFLMPASTHVLTETRTTLQRKALAEPLLHVAWRQPVFNEEQQQRLRLFAGRQFTDDFYYDGFKRSPEQTTDTEDRPPMTMIERINRLLNRIETDPQVFRADAGNQPQSLPDTLLVPERAWELDGLLHIFLVGNYLHIDHDFNLREKVTIDATAQSLAQQADLLLSEDNLTEPFLRAYRFKQRRRVISHETHYFDHPKVGMIIQIRRTKLSPRRF